MRNSSNFKRRGLAQGANLSGLKITFNI